MLEGDPTSVELDILTDRQRQIVRLAARGYTNREIALLLGIKRGTVKAHMETALKASHARNRTHAAFIWGCEIGYEVGREDVYCS